MSTTSQKHRDFVCEPIGEKDVDLLPGIGKVYKERLLKLGFDKAYTVLGQFLILKKDEELFCDWLKSSVEASADNHVRNCYNALKDWTESHI